MNGSSTLNNLAGIFSTESPPTAEEVRAMVAKLPGAGRSDPCWRQAPGVVACQAGCLSARVRLAPDGPTTEQGTGDIVILVDGHVENRAELEAEFGTKADPLSELLRRGYETLGQEIVARLRGAFAIVIVDSKRQRVLLGRDAVGVRPLYFATHGVDGIAFASLPCALTGVRQVGSELDRRIILRDLLGMPTVAPSTWFKHISLVPRGSVVRFEKGHASSWRYWWPGATNPGASSENDYVEEFRSALERSTRSKLDSAPRPVGIALSGGLDSASVLATARSFVGSPDELVAITAVLPGEASGDEPFARAVVERCGVRWRSFSPRGSSVPDDCLSYAANPLVAAHGDLLLEVMQTVMLEGCRVVLFGTSGDFVGGSTPNWRVTLLHEGGPKRLWRELRADSRLGSLRRLRTMAGSVLAYAGARGCIPRVFVPWLRERDRTHARLLALVQASEAERRALDAELKEYARGLEEPYDDVASYAEMVMDRGMDSELCLLDLVSRHVGVECRHPFAEKRLVDLLISLPWGLRRARGRNRIVQRKALEGSLPSGLIERRERLFLHDYFLQLRRTRLGGSRSLGLGPASSFVNPGVWSRYVSDCERLSHRELVTMNQVLALDRWLAS